ncbi:sensor histidine kinase [Amycolatopsis sp. FDAARGOS 1241]|uniref:sensor histidine kinase n=1 Tax=Amycolatopsis sp. FDAARGOS 1241 TaxID=2778070 RepID=UPI00194DB80A|nr:histidine kinase [Amycolatopsis sp. FDAARGOS 1241]QRP46137.1 two-component sensor histidine kinase [Amycolatopsis sp. FDAARGOS 1241]
MPEAPPVQSFSARVAELVRRLGMPVVVLLASLLFDLVFITDAALDNHGPGFVDFALLPGIVAMVGCAIWARRRAAVAAMVGAFALAFFTIFQRYLHTPAYSSVLANLSITDVVAGTEMVYYVARRVRPGVAFAVISSLVVGALIAVFGRYTYGDISDSTILSALLFGSFLLGAAVVIGVSGRTRTGPSEKRMRRLRRVNALVMGQWPLIAALAIALLFEFGYSYDSGTRGFPVLFCSIGAAVIAVLSPRRPGDAILGVAGLLLLSSLVTPFLHLGYDYPLVAGTSPTQIVAGIGVVVNLVRAVPLAKAWPRITVLAIPVAIGAFLNTHPGPYRLMTDPQELGSLVVAAGLVLGISVAVGLFLRSRDSERTQVMKAAVTDAQTTERMALARELHDVVAHHVTGIVVQAQAARMMGEKNPQLALEAMGRIEDAGTEALAAMRRLVRSMRGDAPAGASELSEQATTDLDADLRKLVEGANHNIETTLVLNLPPHLPHEVGRSALRLVQESLTNVGKHAADATEALVHAEVVRNELHLEVRDNGRERAHRPAGGSGGYGLVGMRERVALLHGRLTAGRGPDGGWRVEAWLPLEANGDDE